MRRPARVRRAPRRRLAWLRAPALATTAPSGVELTLPITGALVALGPVGTGLAYVVNYDIVNREGATAASVVTYLLPAVSITLGAAILNESISIATAAGTAVVLASVALVRRLKPPGIQQPAPAVQWRR